MRAVKGPDIRESSADFIVTFPGYGTHTYIRTLPHLPGQNAAMQHDNSTALYHSQHSFHIPPGTHYCWVYKGTVGQEVCPELFTVGAVVVELTTIGTERPTRQTP